MMPARATSIKRELSTGSDSSSDDTETSSSDESYDDPEPPRILPKLQARPKSASQATPARSATNAASSSQITSVRIASDSALQKDGAGSPARFAPSASGTGASQVGNGDDNVRSSNVDKVPKVRALRKYLIGQRMESGEAPLPSPEQLFKAARSHDIGFILANLGPGEQHLYDDTAPSLRPDLLVLFRTRLLVRALDTIVKTRWVLGRSSKCSSWVARLRAALRPYESGENTLSSPKTICRAHARNSSTGESSICCDALEGRYHCHVGEGMGLMSRNASRSLQALKDWRCSYRIVLTSNESHPALGFYKDGGYQLERITLWQLMRRFQDRYQESVRQQSSRKTPQLAKRRRIDSA